VIRVVLPPHLRTRHGIAVVLENRHLFGELTVRNNLDLAAAHGERYAKEQQKISAAHRKFSVGQVLDLFPFMRGRLDDAVELLSGGEQQMVAIARALLLNPELLILDEPSTGLSPKVVRDIVGVMAALREGGMSILLVEQNVALAAETAERAYVMSLGRVVHEIERGIHLCYGDYHHRHFAVPDDLSICVGVAQKVVDQADFIHMPADRETGTNPDYYAPLRDLEPRRLALGVVDYEGDSERTRALTEAATAGTGGMEFAVATECGMARITERGPGGPSLERLLALHAEVAAPIR